MSKNADAFFTFRPGDGIPSPGRNVKHASASTLHGSNVEERADSSEREIGDSCEREIPRQPRRTTGLLHKVGGAPCKKKVGKCPLCPGGVATIGETVGQNPRLPLRGGVRSVPPFHEW